MSEFILSLERSKKIYRAAVSCLFFLQGLCFASWASRIPSIQQMMQLSDATLGVLLFSIPVGSMLALPFAGWLVTRFGSKKVVINALLLYCLLLVTLGFATTVPLLVTSLIFYGAAGNIANIAMNTQAVGVEAKYGRNIMASFHGLWSLAGFTAAGVGTFMIGKNIAPSLHFLLVCGLIILSVIVIMPYLLTDEEKSTERTPLIVKPDKTILRLGLIAFCCMICEGAMFDWSGIYFKKVVHADKAMIGAGYTAFMSTMATGRFLADWVAAKIGLKRTVQYSGVLIATGLLIAILFPYLSTAIAGFLLVGFGVSSVVPLVYSEAGKSKTLSPGMALAAISSIGFLGFLIGPPLIGVVAGISGLSTSFLIIAVMGFSVMLVARSLRAA